MGSVRKRIQQSQQLQTTDEKKTNFSDEIDVSVSYNSESEKVKEIPEKYFMNSNLKNIMPSDYAEKRRDIKHDKYASYWTSEIDKLISVYNETDDVYHISLVNSIMQICEDYVVYTSKSGKIKKDIVLKVCKKFFNNDEKLLSAIIENELKNIIHSTLFRRICARFEVYFFSKI